MFVIMAIVIGGLYAAGLYMMLARSIVKLVFGLVLMSHAANLLIFTVSGLVRAAPPLVAVGDKRLTGPYADPLPQALVLTAIVISFAVLAFTAVLVKRVYATTGTDDSDKLRTTDT